jgi:hypothetical protein
MRWHLAVLAVLSIFSVIATAWADSDVPVILCSEEDDSSWLFQSSYFTHDPDTSKRVAQYVAEPTSYARDDPTYLESGYRHNQIMILGANGTADREHIVQTWGRGELIRPYGEWEFPYRAGATPYGPWGNPQGPWTLPFDSWQNPYGLMGHSQFSSWAAGPYQDGQGNGGPYGGMPGNGAGYGPGPGYGPGYGGGPGPGYGSGYGHGTGSMPYTPPAPPGPGGVGNP